MKQNVVFYLEGNQTTELQVTTATFTVNKYYCKALGDEESNCGAKELNDTLLVEIPVKE